MIPGVSTKLHGGGDVVANRIFFQRNSSLLRFAPSLAVIVLCASAAFCETLSLPADSPRWELQGEAKVVDYLGRKSILLDGGAALLKDFELQDGTVDVDVA